MNRPGSLWQQYQGKAMAELQRGCGYPLQKLPCELEPPWQDFDPHSLTLWECVCNGWDAPWDGSFLKLSPAVCNSGEEIVLPHAAWATDSDSVLDYVSIRIEKFSDDEATIPKATQLLLSLPSTRRPVSFEVLGLGEQPSYGLPNGSEILEARRENRHPESWTRPTIRIQFVAHRNDAGQIRSQLMAHYPNSSVLVEDELDFATDLLPGHDLFYDQGCGSSLAYKSGYLWPLKTYPHLHTDPLGVAVAAMDDLAPFEWAMVQVIFQRAEADWSSALRRALHDPYKPGTFLFDDIRPRNFDLKFATPLYAVGVRLMALRKSHFKKLLGWAEQFAAPPQRLETTDDENYDDLGYSAMARCTLRPGLLMNTEELASLVHLPGPSVVSERLQIVKTRTRPAEEANQEVGSVVLGENIHQGKKRTARISPQLRQRHCYIAGASGTGKSTLLLNMIMQDITAGAGVGLLDPHGDLVKEVVRRIPTNRIDDVVYFDPTDTEHPFALNILDVKDADERERIVNETIMALERHFPASWGPRLERILEFTIYTVLDAVPGATLADVERMLTDRNFRDRVVGKTGDDRLRRFWQDEFRHMPGNAVDPVLNKLSPFLMKQTLRNIICQRRTAVDFDDVLNGGKIFLANLSTGLLTEKVASTFGSSLVSKIVNAAFRRAKLPEERRRPWYLYVDEFQAFMNLSIAFDRILAEARKYRLVLAGLANQYVSQLSGEVRDAIFGNVGTFVTFRLGVRDAKTIASEMGVFTDEEILNLELGQAIVRAGGSAASFNLTTYPPPPVPSVDPTETIRQIMRERHTRSRREVETELLQTQAKPNASAGQKRPQKSKPPQNKSRKPASEPPVVRDPPDDNLVE